MLRVLRQVHVLDEVFAVPQLLDRFLAARLEELAGLLREFGVADQLRHFLARAQCREVQRTHDGVGAFVVDVESVVLRVLDESV